MELAHIPLDQLDVSALNMRHGDKAPYIDDILPSIRKSGVLQTMLVQKKEDGGRFEIVAGRRRYYAAKVAADEQGNPSEPQPCGILVGDDDADALEASLIENMARLDPDPMTQYETFARLVKEGRSPDRIAEFFGLPETAVKQRLALGNLLPKIRDAYRRDEINRQTIRLLTMATKKQQSAWWKLFSSEDEHAPQGQALKRWLLNGDDIRTDAAIFDRKKYKGKLAGDLFDDASYFADPEQFWTLQNEAIAEKAETYKADGWADVEILARGSYFADWNHEKVEREEGGRVYIVVSHSGDVEVHEGYLTTKEARQRQRRKERAEGGQTAEKPVRPEITKAMQNYLELHRHAAVTAELLGQRDLALRLIAAHVVAGSSLWRIEPEPGRADKEAIANSIAGSTAKMALNKERDEILALLGMKAGDRLIRQEWGGPSRSDLFANPCQLKTDDVVRVLTYAMAESLDVGGSLVEALGIMLNVDMANHWQPDEAFWQLLQGRATTNAILADIAGKAVAGQNVTAKIAGQKTIACDCLAGKNGRQKVEGWLPRWMRFPFRAYTRNGGTRIEEAAKKAKGLTSTK